MDIFYIIALIVLFIWNLHLQTVAQNNYNALLKLSDITGRGLDSHEYRVKILEDKINLN